MQYTALTKKAMRICYEAHQGQTDRGGLPYVFHPYHLAEQMKTEEEICVALLHDVLEDSAVTWEQLRQAGFPERVLAAVRLLTHREGESYEDYIDGLAGDALARRVKLADLEHNCDLTRLEMVTEADRRRYEKYQRARKRLWE